VRKEERSALIVSNRTLSLFPSLLSVRFSVRFFVVFYLCVCVLYVLFPALVVVEKAELWICQDDKGKGATPDAVVQLAVHTLLRAPEAIGHDGRRGGRAVCVCVCVWKKATVEIEGMERDKDRQGEREREITERKRDRERERERSRFALL
jgi:hypothetical protein